ncbi:MAG: HAD family phosphatase [Candidatus Omnitrophica bacterium]|nr:HAD family phosphatase [Candidatus Omnitrophota bacterium]
MRKPSQVKAVLFDLGNVLVDFDHTIAAKRISCFCDKTPKEIFDLFFASQITTKFEAGKISSLDFFKEVKKSLNANISYESFVPIWNEIFFLSLKNRQVYSLANKLRDNYLVALLSNINVLHYEYLKSKFPVFNVFHNVFTSCELGFVKPDEEIYRKVIKELGVGAEDIFYTDDRIELIESAKKIGLRSFVFKDVFQLRADLESQGVSI